MKHLSTVLAVSVAAFALLVLLAAPADATPPKGKHYAVALVLVDPESGEIDIEPACLIFQKEIMCTEFSDCGPWEFVHKAGHQNEWRGTLDFFDEDGTRILAEVRGITERLGPGNSIGGTIYLTLDGVGVNAAFAGTRVPRAACLEFGLSDD